MVADRAEGAGEKFHHGICIDEKLRFKLRVSGNSGCNRYMKGKPAHAKGSSGQPPTAKATR